MEAAKEKNVLPVSMVQSIQTLQRVFGYLLKKWWIILIAGILGGLGGIYYAYKQKPKYESRLTFALDEGGNASAMGGAMALAAQFGLGGLGGSGVFAGDNIIEIIRSRRMVESILLSVDSSVQPATTMIEEYLTFTNKRKTYSNLPRLKDVHFIPGKNRSQFSRLQDSVLFAAYDELVKERLTVGRPDKRLNIVEVKLLSESETFSKVFTERLVAEANNFYAEVKSKKSLQTLAILEERIGTLKGGLNSSISARASVQDANISPAYQQAQVPLQKQQVNIQVYSAAYAEMFKNLEIARFQYLNAVPLMQIIDQAEYPMKKIKKGKLVTGIVGAIFFSFLVVVILLVKYYAGLFKKQVKEAQAA